MELTATDACELQKVLPDTTRYVMVHINNEFFFSVSAFGSELMFSCSGSYFWLLQTVVLSPL